LTKEQVKTEYEVVNYTDKRTWSRVHKAFQNQDQDQAQVKYSSTMDFFLKPTIII